MTPTNSFLWFDLETFGLAPRRDRPAQFAAIRTNAELEEVGSPINLLCQPTLELVPAPDACRITGLTPQHCAANGLPEPAFARAILESMQQPGTCSVGYNSMRFDDEVCRFLFYRNLLPVYDREWRQGNSRWDLLDVLRLTYAFKPDTLIWPQREDGSPSFKLEHLAQANHIDLGQAHDALTDVRVTIELARRIRQQQPKLFAWALQCRDKSFVKAQISVLQHKPFLWVSGRVPARLGALTAVLPLQFHPTNNNELIGWDLRYDPAILANLDAETLATRLNQRPQEPTERLAFVSIHLNRAPMVAPITLLSPEVSMRTQLDSNQIAAHAQNCPPLSSFWPTLQASLEREFAATDAEQALYAGFINDTDQACIQQIHQTPSSAWPELTPPADDRLQTLWWRYQLRYGSEPVPVAAQSAWKNYLKAAFDTPETGCAMTLTGAQQRLQEVMTQYPEQAELWQALTAFLTEQQQRRASLD